MKPDGLVPVPLVLDLWALGHSQKQIAEMVGLPNRKHVERIVANARRLGDKRAVRHSTAGRIMGKAIPFQKRVHGRHKTVDGVEVVPALGKPLCRRGHPRTPDNLKKSGCCKICAAETTSLRYYARRASQKASQ